MGGLRVVDLAGLAVDFLDDESLRHLGRRDFVNGWLCDHDGG